jgi:hypothetical protein
VKAVKAFLLGLVCVGLGLFDIYRRKASLMIFVSWGQRAWLRDVLAAHGMSPDISQSDSPFMFWLCVAPYFVTAILCFVVAVAYAQPES